MSIIQVNEQGVETLKKASTEIKSASDELSAKTDSLKSSLEQYSGSLGEHYDSLIRTIETIQQVIKRSAEPVDVLSMKLAELADKYQDWIDDDPFKGLN